MIGIVAAHPAEVWWVRRRLTGRRRYRGALYGRLQGIPVAIVCTGQGWTQAEAATARLLELTQCAGVVVTGFSGATHPDLVVGDVVIPDRVLDLHGEERPSDEPAAQPPVRLQALRDTMGAHGGAVGTVRAVVVEPQDKERLGREAGIVAVDLESAAAVGVAQLRGIPWIVARVILDAMDRPLGVASRLHAVALAVSVAGWGRLWRFALDLVVAQRRLGEELGAVVEELHRLAEQRAGA